jgi:tRNA (guanine-N7-)-methyltransferase
MGTPRSGARTQTGVQALSKNPPPCLFGRRKGRPLRAHKTQLMETLLPQLQIELPEKSPLDPKKLFSHRPREIWVEIGFGGGEYLAAIAAQHPDIGFIGAEPFINGIAGLLDHIEKQKLSNIRIFPDDARKVLDILPDASINRCFVLFPDPWPKARHAERRFIGPENLPRLARILCPDAELRLATDDPKLSPWMIEYLEANEQFAKHFGPSERPPADWVQTRYEQKALKAGRKPLYFSYRRV